MFENKASTGDALITLLTTGDILEKCPQSPPDKSAVGQSLGELFGKQSSPVKAYLCNKKNCKKATFTHEAQEDDSIPVLCADHAKNLPGAYIAKGMM